MNNTADYVYRISEGNEGVRETLYLMQKLVREARRDPDFVAFARRLTANVPEKDWRRRILTVFHFVRDRVRYTLDPNGVEYIASPQRMITILEGDCDDKAAFLAALLEAIGIPTRFVAVGFDGAELSHVFVEAKFDSRWIALDATEPVRAGWRPEAVKNSYTVHN